MVPVPPGLAVWPFGRLFLPRPDGPVLTQKNHATRVRNIDRFSFGE
jgi:hypothetical protein